MPILTSGKPCDVCNPCGGTETVICPEPQPVELPSVCEPINDCESVPFAENFSSCMLPAPPGSLVKYDSMWYYTPTYAYNVPGKLPWRRFKPQEFFRMYKLLTVFALNIYVLDGEEVCNKKLAVPADGLAFYNGKLWHNTGSTANATLPPAAGWSGGKTPDYILKKLLEL